MSTRPARAFISELSRHIGEEVLLKGWIYRLRDLAKTTFVILSDASGSVQCVAGAEAIAASGLKLEDAVEIRGCVRAEARAKQGFEVDILETRVVGAAAAELPFHANSKTDGIGQDLLVENRPLYLRTEAGGLTFRLQAALVEAFREFLRRERFTEIFSSKFVAGGTEGGTNLFEVKYFDRIAYLAQSPQFYKEQGVCGLERVFETGHVYRAEPHATSRHLTEYYSLDLEMGFIESVREIIELERALLEFAFAEIARKFPAIPRLPSMAAAPVWEFAECLERLRIAYGRSDLVDDLDPEGERQLCELAEKEFGTPTVFVLGFPLSSRPFYTHPLADARAKAGFAPAASFDLLFRGLEITTGGQRIHRRAELEAAIRAKGMTPSSFESHLRAFDFGMPPHGGLAIGAERLTAQILGIANVKQATLYPRDRYRITP